MRFADAVVGLLVLVACAAMVALGLYVLVGWQGWREWSGWLMAVVFMGAGLAPLVVLGRDAWYLWWQAPGRAYMRRERYSFWLYRHGWHWLVKLLNNGHCYALGKDPGHIFHAVCECGVESIRWHKRPCYLGGREPGALTLEDEQELPF